MRKIGLAIAVILLVMFLFTSIAGEFVVKRCEKPDLIVCKYAPLQLRADTDKQLLIIRVYNIGKAPSAYCLLRIDCSNFKGKEPVPPLNPGAYKEYIYPKAHIDPSLRLLYTFHVDCDGWIPECHENNNVCDGVLSYSTSEPQKCSDGKLH